MTAVIRNLFVILFFVLTLLPGVYFLSFRFVLFLVHGAKVLRFFHLNKSFCNFVCEHSFIFDNNQEYWKNLT